MAVTITPLGQKKPDGGELFRGGDNIIADNAQNVEDLIQADRGRLGNIETAATALTGRVTATENTAAAQASTLTTHGTRLTNAENSAAALAGRVTTAETNITTQGTRVGTFESQIAGLSAQVAAVSTPFNIGIDLDGVPFYSDGASGLALAADTDGVPYFL